MTETPFVHLHVHSEFSLVDSTVRIPDLMSRCAEFGMPAVALTDQNNLFGMVKFYKKALATGVKPIIGADVLVADDDDPGRPFRLILLCKDNDGYRNLSRLISRAFLEGQHRGVPLLNREWLEKSSCAGLIALSAGMSGDIGRALVLGHKRQARARLQHWQKIFDERFYLELVRTGRTKEENCVQLTLALASETGVPVVASNDVRFLDDDGYHAHEARVCIHEGRSLADPDRPRDYSKQQYLKTPAEMAELFADAPEAIANSVEIARRCNLDLTLGESILPAFPVPKGQNEEAFLASQAKLGLQRLLDKKFDVEDVPAKMRDAASAPYKQRLDSELRVICDMGFPGYFLIVADFIRWARENDVP
ncbi:MAG: PHP domain-containing protein, partial [Woeseiaceae bacterium]|nr:PHP domain-containing protein [Woeseiaceae bacterium]